MREGEETEEDSELKGRALGIKGVQKERDELFYWLLPPSHPLFSQMPNHGSYHGSYHGGGPSRV